MSTLITRNRVRKAQSSVEYILITSFSMILIILVVSVFYTYTHQTTDQLIASQVDAIGQSFVHNAEMIYFYGPPAHTTLDVTVPEHVQRLYFVNKNQLIIDVALTRGNVSQAYFSRINLTGSFARDDTLPGEKHFKLSAKNNDVNIERIG